MEGKKNQGEKGVTLLGLVVTVIIMMILATIIILNENKNQDMINISEKKKQETEILSIKENIKTTLLEDPPNTYNQLIYEIMSYGEILNIDDPQNAELKIYDTNYIIPVKELWNVNFTKAGPQIGEYVLYTNENSENLVCRVFDKNEKTDEVQIVPISSNISADIEFGGPNNLETFIELVDMFCETMINNKNINTKAKCVKVEDVTKSEEETVSDPNKETYQEIINQGSDFVYTLTKNEITKDALIIINVPKEATITDGIGTIDMPYRIK